MTRESTLEAALSAESYSLLLGICTHKKGFELPFPLHIYQASALARVTQLLQGVLRLLRHLENTQSFIYSSLLGSQSS